MHIDACEFGDWEHSSGLYLPSTVFNRTTLLSCFISRSMRIEVMPHSATSRERGEAISTTMAWNSGVALSHFSMSVPVLKQVGLQDSCPSCSGQATAIFWLALAIA